MNDSYRQTRMEETTGRNTRRRVWYALQTYNLKELKVEAYLKEEGFSPFIPMLYREHVTLEGKKVRELFPAVHNLLFLPKDDEWEKLERALLQCPVPVRILRHKDSTKYYEIPDAQMIEFRAICDPNYTGTLYTDRDFAEARPGQPVRVVHGVFKGLKGKLVRYKNRSFVVITLATLGVFVHIPKWYCERIDD